MAYLSASSKNSYELANKVNTRHLIEGRRNMSRYVGRWKAVSLLSGTVVLIILQNNSASSQESKAIELLKASLACPEKSWKASADAGEPSGKVQYKYGGGGKEITINKEEFSTTSYPKFIIKTTRTEYRIPLSNIVKIKSDGYMLSMICKNNTSCISEDASTICKTKDCISSEYLHMSYKSNSIIINFCDAQTSENAKLAFEMLKK